VGPNCHIVRNEEHMEDPNLTVGTGSYVSIQLAAHCPHRFVSLWMTNYRSCSTKFCTAEATEGRGAGDPPWRFQLAIHEHGAPDELCPFVADLRLSPLLHLVQHWFKASPYLVDPYRKSIDQVEALGVLR
jgi:hypothetical protein